MRRPNCHAFQPSLFEGWSTIVEDARSLSKTILLSDIEVHREQMGSAFLHYISPQDHTQWADRMADILHNAEPGPDLENERHALIEVKQRQKKYGKELCANHARGHDITFLDISERNRFELP